MTAAPGQLEPCRHPDDKLRCIVYAPCCAEFKCGVCGAGRIVPSKRCPTCSCVLIAAALGAGITVLRCPEGCGETLEIREPARVGREGGE